MTKYKKSFAEWTNFMPESEVRRLLKVKVPYYFGGGLPGLLPYQTFVDIFKEIISDYQQQIDTDETDEFNADLNYGVTLGNPKLREVFAERFKRVDGVDATVDTVAISTGSQQILYGIIDSVCNPGDIILTARPTYLGFLNAANKLKVRVVTVDSDLQGMRSDCLMKALRLLEAQGDIDKVKLIYVIPEADNPTGTTIPMERRKQIFDLAEKYDCLILEDTAYRELCFSEFPAPIKTLDKDNERVIYSRTTSKECASIRLGYTVMPESVIDVFGKDKGFMDLCTPSITQKIALVYYGQRYIDKAIPVITEQYKVRSRLMMKTMDESFPSGVRTSPDGGFFIWWESDKEFDAAKFLAETAIPNDVLYVPGAAFYPLVGEAYLHGKINPNIIKQNTMRLSYSFNDNETIVNGITKLGKILTDHLG